MCRLLKWETILNAFFLFYESPLRYPYSIVRTICGESEVSILKSPDKGPQHRCCSFESMGGRLAITGRSEILTG